MTSDNDDLARENVERPVEPSDAERAALPTNTLHYLEYLEGVEDENERLVVRLAKVVTECLAQAERAERAADTIKSLRAERDEAAKALADVLAGKSVRNADEIITRAALGKEK